MKKALIVLLGLLIITLSSCITYPTSLAVDKSISSQFYDSDISISNIQYEYNSMPVSSRQSFTPLNPKLKIAILQLQVKNIKQDREYDFYNITLNKNGTAVHPNIIRYFKGNSVYGTDWGFQLPKANTLKVAFINSASYTIMLGYICETNDRFDSVTIDGKDAKFDNVYIKKGTFIDKFYVTKN